MALQSCTFPYVFTKIFVSTSLAGMSTVPGALAILNIECSGLPIPLGVARFPMGQRRLKHVSGIFFLPQCCLCTTRDRVRLHVVNCALAIWKLSFVYEEVHQTAEIVNLPSILEYRPANAPRILFIFIVLVNFAAQMAPVAKNSLARPSQSAWLSYL